MAVIYISKLSCHKVSCYNGCYVIKYDMVCSSHTQASNAQIEDVPTAQQPIIPEDPPTRFYKIREQIEECIVTLFANRYTCLYF